VSARATTPPATIPQDVLDKLAIRELLERYMRHNDDGNVDDLVELFATDATMQVMGRTYKGHTEIRSLFATSAESTRQPWTEPGQLHRQPRSLHISSNPVIEIKGDSATAETDFLVVTRNEAGKAAINLAGRYRDRLQRDAQGHWLISTRTAVSVAKPGEEGTEAEWQRAFARSKQQSSGLLIQNRNDVPPSIHRNQSPCCITSPAIRRETR
jgi:hypothetical protein